MNTTGPNNISRGADQVSRAYQAAKFDEEPPAELDRAILAAARRQRRRPLASYLPPLALAATVVLSVSLVLRSGVLNENAEIFFEEAPQAPAVRTESISPSRELDEAVVPQEAAPRERQIELIQSLRTTAGATSSLQTGCTDADREQPAAWLACIAMSVAQGNEDGAREELAAFSLAFPDYSLPADLEAALAP